MRGLALGGGAAFGAWQAGRMWRLVAEGADPWELVAGCSVGSVNALHLAQYPIGEEAEAVGDLRDLWHGLRTKDVHKRWCPFGQLHALWKTGVRDVRPLGKFLRSHVDLDRVRDSGRRIIVGAVTQATHEEVEWTEVDAEVLVEAVLASCAIPYAFEPQAVRGVPCVDWGVRTVVPVASLVREGCIDVDAISCNPEAIKPSGAPGNALDAGLAAVGATTHQIEADDLRGWDGVDLRVHRPDRHLGSSLDFSRRSNAWRWSLGSGEV